MDPSPSAIAAVSESPTLSHIKVPHDVIKNAVGDTHQGSHAEAEAGAVARFMKRRGSLVAAATTMIKSHDGLSDEQRDKRRKDKLERDAWCRREQVRFVHAIVSR